MISSSNFTTHHGRQKFWKGGGIIYILCTSMPICDLYFPQRKEYIPPWVTGLISFPPLGICVAGIWMTSLTEEHLNYQENLPIIVFYSLIIEFLLMCHVYEIWKNYFDKVSAWKYFSNYLAKKLLNCCIFGNKKLNLFLQSIFVDFWD